MLTRLKSYFSEHSSNEPSKTTQSRPTWVYIWKTTPKTVGHVGIQVDGDSPKMTNEQPGEYASLHPKSIPAFGLTSVLPLPATLATSLGQDIENEGSSIKIDRPEDLPNLSSSSYSPAGQPPDLIFKIDGLNTDAMLERINEAKKDVQSGESAYQLLPNVNVVMPLYRFFRDASAFVSQDPIDSELYRKHSARYQQLPQTHPDNCVTFASDVLHAGGLPIKLSKMPWGLTPNGLAEQLTEKGLKGLKR